MILRILDTTTNHDKHNHILHTKLQKTRYHQHGKKRDRYRFTIHSIVPFY